VPLESLDWLAEGSAPAEKNRMRRAQFDYLGGRPPFDERVRYPFPDLLLLDLKMPKRNGFDVLSWLKSRPDMDWLPVVVLSSSALPEDREVALRMGALEFRTKPGDTDDLVRLLNDLHERWLIRVPPPPHKLCRLSEAYPQIHQTAGADNREFSVRGKVKQQEPPDTLTNAQISTLVNSF